jgi:hypothetical protein
MALVQFGGSINEIRGRFQGLVYSRNNSGCFVKAQKAPVNRQTDAQGVIRVDFNYSVQQWRAISISDKALWDAYALNPPEIDVDPFGVQRYLSGYQWAMRVWGRQVLVGDALIDAPGSASPVVPPSAAYVTTNLSMGEIILYYNSGSFSAGDSLVCSAVLGRIGTQNAATSGYYIVWAGGPSTSTSSNLWAPVTGLVGQAQIGQFYKINAWRQTPDGVRSPVLTFQGVCA